MSDVGLGASLELNITDALRRVDQLGRAIEESSTVVLQVDTTSVAPEITRAVEAADTAVVIEPDTTGISQDITGAVEAADTAVVITGDAAEVTGSIDAAVEAADSAVVITADAADVTGSIDGAVAAANTQVTVTGDAGALRSQVQGSLVDQGSFGPISVDGDLDPELNADIANLGANLADASDEGRALGKVLGLLSIGAAAAGLRALGDAASDLAESTSKAGVVFGQEFPAIERFATGAADAVGLSNQAAFEAAGTFGNLFQALGTSREEAARLSPLVVQLAGDLASFNNIGTDEALEKLRSGLVGEIEPLRQLGVSFNALDVETKALELGLGAVGRELTEGEKVQARYALITEQTALAQGDFARTSDGLANQQRILQAEFQNAAAAAGGLLLPAFLALLEEVRGALPSLEEFGAQVLPAVGDALENLAPLIGTTAEILVALGPAISIVAELLAQIPDPVIAIGAGLIIANKAFGGLGGILSGSLGALKALPGIFTGIATAVPRATSGVGPLAGGITGLAQSFATLNPLTVAAGVLAVGLFSEWQRGRDEARAYAEELDELGASLETVDGFQQLTTAGVSKYVEEQSKINAKDQIEDLNRLGISFDQIASMAQLGAQGQSLFVDALVRGGDLTRVTRNEFGELVTATGKVIDANSELGKSLEDVGVDGLVVGNTALVKSYQEIGSVTDDVAKRQIELLQAQGLLTDAQVRQALGTNDSGEATRSYAQALNDLEPIVVRAARAAEESIAKYGPLADVFLGVADAAASLRDSAPEAQAAIEQIRLGGADPTAASLVDLAATLDEAALSEEQMAEAAIGLGTDVDTLRVFIETTSTALTDFVDAAITSLPSVAQAFRDANDDSKVSAKEFSDALIEDAIAVAKFTADLSTIVVAGFSEVAGVLAEQGAETAGQAAAELAAAAQAGNTTLLEETQAGLDTRDQAIADSTAFLRDTLGPEFVEATGQVGTLASEALGVNFTPEEEVRIKVGLAALEMDEEGKQVAAIAALKGADAAQDYGNALNLDQETIDAAVAAGVAIRENAPTGAAKTAGEETGKSFSTGLATGIIDPGVLELVRAAMRRAAETGVIAIEDQLAVGSPSKVAMRIGGQFTEGFALGIEGGESGVVSAAEAIARAAVNAADTGFDLTQVAPPGVFDPALAVPVTPVASVAPEVALAAVGAGPGGGSVAVAELPAGLVDALEAIARQGPNVQVGPIYAADPATALREGVTEARSIARGGRL